MQAFIRFFLGIQIASQCILHMNKSTLAKLLKVTSHLPPMIPTMNNYPTLIVTKCSFLQFIAVFSFPILNNKNLEKSSLVPEETN